MAVNWTKSQREAIDLRGDNLLVAAGAGSGKTAVLVERVIHRVLDEKDPVDIDRFLVLTFTKAAAGEMKEKILKRLLKALFEDPDNPHLQRQAALIHGARINTIHAFCNDLVKENFHKLGLSSDFRTADETELLLIKADCARRVLDEAYEQENSGPFEELLNLFTEARSDEGAAELIIEITDKLSSGLDPEKRLFEMEEAFLTDPSADLGQTPWGESVLRLCREEVFYYVEVLKRALDRLRPVPEIEAAYGPALTCDLDQLRAVGEKLETGVFDEACGAFSHLAFERLGTARGFAGHPAALGAKEARGAAREGLSKMQERFFCQRSSSWLADITALAPAVGCLCGLVRSFQKAFAEEKKKRNIIDFSDQEHFALALLTDPENTSVLNQVQEKYIEILIDEYQDTNEVQEGIFQAVSGGRDNIFMVGDVKQSIYRFRQACPALFLEKYLSYGGGEGAGGGRKVTLSDNFRSRRGILDFVNDLFGHLMSPALGEIDYNEGEFLRYGGLYPDEEKEPAVELLLLEEAGPKEEREEGEGKEEKFCTPVEREAALVAQRIRRLMEEKTTVYDTRLGCSRSLRYRDIVVLMRSVKSKAPVYEEVFSSFSIPVYSDAAKPYFETAEILAMLSLLRVIDNPLQDVPLVSVMRSGIFPFTEDDILLIRKSYEEGPLFDAVRRAAKEGEEKCARFVGAVDRWRRQAADMTADQLIWFLYEDTRFFDLCGAMANGKLRQANLRMLFEYARKFEETSFKGLYNFLNFIGRLMEKEGDFLSAKILSENSDVVRIMSIHKSKGLEFPVCFLCETGSGFNYADIRTGMIFHDRLGFGPQFKDIERKITYPTVAKGALNLVMEREMLCEEMRIFYVALTRAKERLIITGRVKDAGGKMARMGAFALCKEGKIHPSALIQNASYLEWLLLFLTGHPDAAALRRLAGAEEEEEGEKTRNSRLAVSLCAPAEDGEAGMAWIPACAGMTDEEDTGDERAREALKERLVYEYPLQELSLTPAKVSVTELKGRPIEGEIMEKTDEKSRFLPVTFPEPAFIREGSGISPARRGTAVHLAMQYLDFDKCESEEAIAAQLQALAAGGFLPAEEAGAVSPRGILRFFESPLAERIKGARRVWREEKFNLAVPRGLLYGKTGKEAVDQRPVLVQGIIDCFFEEEEGRAVIIDFKTDKLRASDFSVLLSRYQTQMALYKRAVEEIYQKQASGLYIYLFHTGETVEIPLL